MYGFLTAEALFRSPNITELILVTNNAAGNCNTNQSRGFFQVQSFSTHFFDDLSIIVKANSTTFRDFAESIEITYGLVDSDVVPNYKRSLHEAKQKRDTDAVVQDPAVGSLVSSTSNVDAAAVVEAAGGTAALGGNVTSPGAVQLLTIPPELCDEDCQNDITNGLDGVGLLTAEGWAEVITEGLENAALNPPEIGQDSDINFVFNDPSATYTDLTPSQVVAVDAADPQITKRAVLPEHKGFQAMLDKRFVDNSLFERAVLAKRGCGIFAVFCSVASDASASLASVASAASRSAASVASKLSASIESVGNVLINDAEREYSSASAAGAAFLTRIEASEASVVNAIEATYSAASARLTGEIASVKASATAVIASVASVASKESQAAVSLASQEYASASSAAASIASAAKVLANDAASEAASAASRASAAAQTFLSQAEAKATQVAQVITVVAQDGAQDIADAASDLGDDVAAAAAAVAAAADTAVGVVGNGIENIASQAESTYNEVTSAVEKALGEHDVSCSGI